MIVAVQPVLPVEPGHVAEAARALRAQQRPIANDDDAIVRLLWAARALPVALDVLADARHPKSRGALTSIVFESLETDAAPTRAQWVAVAHASDGDDWTGIVVQFVERTALLSSDEAVPYCVVRFAVGDPELTETGDGVAVVRFSV